jgi:hypothetical protein
MIGNMIMQNQNKGGGKTAAPLEGGNIGNEGPYTPPSDGGGADWMGMASKLPGMLGGLKGAMGGGGGGQQIMGMPESGAPITPVPIHAYGQQDEPLPSLDEFGRLTRKRSKMSLRDTMMG